MVALGGQYDGEESSYDPIPPGEYPMHITASAMEPTKDGRGRFLKLEMEILDGQQAGRKITDRLNLENPNAKAVEIAQRTLRAIVHACDLTSCSDSEQLHMRRMLVRVNVKERTDKPGVMSNEIGGYKRASGGGAAMAQSQPSGGGAQQQPQQSAGGGGSTTPPWKRG